MTISGYVFQINSFRIQRMGESGLLVKFEEVHKLSGKCDRKKEEMSKSHALTITEVMMTFLVLGAGVISAMLVLILENIIYYLRKTWQQKVQSY